MGIPYSKEIDGLRAVAVLAVVLYHAGLGGAGFVGVDIFFVISGYLITSLLLKEQASGSVDLFAFYARRVRRIFPAAVFVVLATLAGASLLLSPDQQVQTAKSAGAALVFGANVFFQTTTGGYFDAPSEQMPLLHLWSLSVEEQFYLLWPVLLIFLPRRWLVPALIVLASISLAVAEYWIGEGSDAAFYGMPSRAWELAAGGLIAASPPGVARPLLARAGVVLTFVACALPIGHFPGIGALPAVLGACAVLWAVHGGTSNAVLSSKPMVGVGLISYSLYLWHWPLLAFYRASIIGAGSVQVRLLLCAFAVLLAIATYRYIEQPFRHLRFKSGRTIAVGAALSSMLAVSACAVAMHVENDLAARADNPIAAAAGQDMATKACHISGRDRMLLKCRPHSRTLVWGDSMAWSWLPAVPDGSDVSMDSCPPFVGYLPGKPVPASVQCRDHNTTVVKLPADTVVLVALWNIYGDLRPLVSTLDALAKVPQVVIIGPTPEMHDAVPHCIRANAEHDCSLRRADFDAGAKPILARLRALASHRPNVQVVDVTDHFCTQTMCPPVLGGVPLYWDSHHITRTAAGALAPVIRASVRPVH